MSIKLTEDQLAGIFQNNSKQHTANCAPDDCLSAMPASDNRLKHVEELANDHTSAQAMKAAMSLRDWSQIMAQSIENSRRSWFNILGMNSPLKTSLATVAFAMAVVVALPEFKQIETQIHQPIAYDVLNNDIITHAKFDESGDRILRGGFDSAPSSSEQDNLFNGSFG